MTVALSIVTVDPADIVTVVDSEGATWTVLISSACAVSCGNNISHRVSSAVINADLIINRLINLSPLIRAMSNRVIISFYYTKKRASTWLTLLIVGLFMHEPSFGS
jgi:hypothetical protein